MYYAGIDIGTSKVKFVVYNNDLLLKEYEKKQSVIHNDEGDLINTKKIIENVYSLFKEAFSDYPEIAGVSITSFGESFVCLDENDEPLFDIPLFIDKSGLDELDFIKSKIDERKLYQITGCPLEAMYSLPKILSLKHKYKDSFSKIKKILLIEDYVIYKLTGQRYIDYGLACRTMLFDIHKLEWSEEILNLFNIDKAWLSQCVEIGNIAGNILSPLKSKLGITNNVKIINGSHDQIAVAIGSQLTKDNFALGLGTCECLIVPIDLNKEDELLKARLPIVPFNKELFITYGLINHAGSLIDYFVNLFNIDLKDYEFNLPLSEDYIITNFEGKNSQKIQINTDFTRKNSDYMDLLFESLSYELKAKIDYFRSIGLNFKSILVSGGSSVNSSYLKLISSVCEVDIIQGERANVGLIGNAIIAGKSLGYFKDYNDGFNRLNKSKALFTPDKFSFDRYQKYINMKKVVQQYEL